MASTEVPKGERDDLLPPKQVVEQYPIFGSTGSLAERRWRGQGPTYIKTSDSRAGRVFYRRSAIEKWLDERTVTGGAAA